MAGGTADGGRAALGRPLVSTASFSLLLVGGGPGGAGLAFAKDLGLWVTAFEADPALAAVATERIRRTKLSKRVETRLWDPDAPAFGPDTYHHAICLEPLCGRPVVPLLTACAASLRPAAQIVLTELVADEPLARQDPAMLAWARLEPSRGPDLPTEREISRAMTRLGFDVRVAEDITAHHLECCLQGWRLLVRELKRDNLPLARAYCMVREAELWMNRLKLMQQGKLRLVRWHGFSRAGTLLVGPAAPH
jgi:cyclopropane fatty-acyl-phospholipid synthase-like methyltransferase